MWRFITEEMWNLKITHNVNKQVHWLELSSCWITVNVHQSLNRLTQCFGGGWVWYSLVKKGWKCQCQLARQIQGLYWFLEGNLLYYWRMIYSNSSECAKMAANGGISVFTDCRSAFTCHTEVSFCTVLSWKVRKTSWMGLWQLSWWVCGTMSPTVSIVYHGGVRWILHDGAVCYGAIIVTNLSTNVSAELCNCISRFVHVDRNPQTSRTESANLY